MAKLTDQQIRDAGILFLSPQRYLKNPFKLPEEGEEQEGVGITLTNVPQTGGGGGGGGASPFDLTPTFTTERSLAPTTDFNINPAAFLTGKGRTDPMGSDMDYFLNLPAEQRFSFGFRDSNIPGSPNYEAPDQFFEEPNLIDRGIGAFKNFFRPRKIRGTLGDRLFKQTTGTMAGLPTISNIIGRFRNPLNPNSANYNKDLVGQLNFLEAQDGLIGRDQGSGILKYGPESVLFGKNVISGFGTNDYEEALNKYIESAKLKLRRTTNDETRKKIQKRIDKGELELTTYLDKSGVQKDRDDRRQDIITKETKRREDKGDTTRAGSEDTATGGFGGGKDLAFKKGGLAKILGY